MIGAIQDITEGMQHIKAIEKQNKKLREIAWIQSHVVRAPLSRIMGLIDLLMNYPDEEQSRELMGYILISARELDEVIHSIVSRTEDITGSANNPDSF
jgi:light-regulated signal transduction histidine kinase (bacteriophytochrome)